MSEVLTDPILNELEEITTEIPQEIGLLKIKTANQWIKESKNKPIPKMLFGEFWFQGELCILFSDTNLGKTILAVQIANSISKGEQIKGFKLGTSRQIVLYFDFELSDKQFEARYSKDFEKHYKFDDNFFRIEINPNADNWENFESEIINSIEQSIIKTNARIIIIDNITYLKSETEHSKYALPLMKQLKLLKDKYKLSLLVLAHTPKRDLSKPLTRNDLQGSKMLINFCDSSFAIGESTIDKSIRYFKQIKARATEIIYDSENIMITEVNKPFNFLGFEFIRYENEKRHLKHVTENEKQEIENKIIEIKSHDPDRSLRSIAEELKISHMKVKRTLEKKGM